MGDIKQKAGGRRERETEAKKCYEEKETYADIYREKSQKTC